MKKLLAVFGNPQERIKYIHIAGTNGKGSTSKLLYELIYRNGLRTGLFTSPYIEIFNERIQLDDKNIENELLFSICNQVITVQNQLGLDLNQFAILTCIAFIYYSAKNADYVVLETGLGGTFDPTNIILKPECCIITNIGLDHTQVLGNLISEIASAKAGIIKENVPVVCYPVCDEALKVISDAAKSKNAQLQLFEAKVNEDDSFILNNEHYTTSLAGSYQCLNACNALTAYEILAKKDSRLVTFYAYKNAALNNTKWKGRLEIISKKPLTYVDGGHNPQCIAAVTDYIAKKYSNRRKFYIAGFMKDKAYDEMVRILVENSDELHLVPVKNVRSLQTFELTNLKYVDNIKVYADSSLSEAYQKAVKNCDDQGVIVIIGSLYQLKEAYDLT
jgi:dihydrofolate synthase/folylpolyglutamate synthase